MTHHKDTMINFCLRKQYEQPHGKVTLFEGVPRQKVETVISCKAI